MKHRAVFFDVGETLVHPHPSFPELFDRVLRREGVRVDPSSTREALYLVSDRFSRAAKANELWTTSAERSKGFWLSTYREMLDRLGLLNGEHLAEKLYVEFTDLSNYHLFEDVLPVLELLETHGLRLAVVSNFEEWLERLLESLDVTRFFDVRVISGVEGLEKPDPRIFRIALERAGVAAAESVYVGDSPEFDVAPASAVGMLPVLLDRRGRYPDHPGVRITNLEDLPAALGLVQ